MSHDPGTVARVTMDDFDAFVKAHGIADNEMGAAFAAWLSGAGWDGDFQRVGPA